jgi:hypothetical protein
MPKRHTRKKKKKKKGKISPKLKIGPKGTQKKESGKKTLKVNKK